MRNNSLNKKNSFKGRNGFFFGSAFFLAFSIVVYISSRLSTLFADFFSEYIGGFIRLVLASSTSLLPFSVAEAIVLIFIPVSVIIMFFAPDVDEGSLLSRNTLIFVGILFLIVAIFLTAFAPCYFRTSIENEMELDRDNISAKDICSMIDIVSSELEKLSPHIITDCTGKSLMPLSYSQLVAKLNKTYSDICKDLDFLGNFYSRPKSLAISKLMPYTRISGIYTFFTGESNVSVAYPDFTIPFTTAHEMAHQRGIAREDEANFIAFLVCINSDDVYIQYSGYTEIMQYLLNSLYISDNSLYISKYLSTPEIYKKEDFALTEFFKKTEFEFISNATDTLNDTMLQSHGQSAGSDSYGLVTELATAYYKKEGLINNSSNGKSNN